MKFGVPRLAQGITRDLFPAGADIHQASLAGYGVRELEGEERAEQVPAGGYAARRDCHSRL